jgi:hypothetical protein
MFSSCFATYATYRFEPIYLLGLLQSTMDGTEEHSNCTTTTDKHQQLFNKFKMPLNFWGLP